MIGSWGYSRRSFLRRLGWAGLGGWTARAGGLLFGAQAAGARPFPFARIPNSQCGITFIHQNGHSSQYYEPETTGAGCAFLDYDNDGWMDIYLVNSGKCDFYDPNPPLRNALYHNNRDGTFTDVTEKAGVGSGGYGQGVAVGDFDGDGWPDIYLTQYGRNVLYRNNHDGTFTDVTDKAGVTAPGWSSSAVWFDYDNDGKLDLFVCRFVDYSKEKNKICGNKEIGVRYCIPSLYDPMPSWLFHNNGDGTFTDVSKQSGIGSVLGKAWGVVATDINNDGRMDLFVSNDTVPNFLFANRGNGKFEEIGLQAGVAYSSDSVARSGMGIDSADYDQDGWMDLFVDNVDHEMYSLYHNDRDETFTDVAISNGIGMTTYMMSGWGVKFFDYDNDGNIDLFIANGHPDDKIGEQYSAVTYREPLLLFRNIGGSFQRAFENVSTQGGPLFTERFAARGMAVGDFDNDGAVDVLVAVNGGAPLLLRNMVGSQNHWLGLRLIGKKCNPDAVGARVTWQSGDFKRSAMKTGGGSYLASHDPRMVLGLGPRTKLDWVEIKWPQPSGLVERITNPPINRYVTVIEGKGIVP
ncbi:MAG TPA: CRTAC1 family protein [Terriglobia bacterium]|nr:CRTAC1 family protein [Terriglobia bacterium]